MRFKATEDQVIQIFVNAARVVAPWVTVEQARMSITIRDGDVFADYVCGVEVGLYAYYQGNGEYEISDGNLVLAERQRWRKDYITTEALIRSVV